MATTTGVTAAFGAGGAFICFCMSFLTTINFFRTNASASASGSSEKGICASGSSGKGSSEKRINASGSIGSSEIGSTIIIIIIIIVNTSVNTSVTGSYIVYLI